MSEFMQVRDHRELTDDDDPMISRHVVTRPAAAAIETTKRKQRLIDAARNSHQMIELTELLLPSSQRALPRI